MEPNFEKTQPDRYHSDSVPELSFWWQTRAPERFEYGENITFGPGYGQCIEHYYESDLDQNIPNNKLLDLTAEKISLPRDRIVPIMAGSINNNEYLGGVIIPEKIIPLSADLDIVVCKNPDDALKLRGYSPILLPLSATKKVIYSLENNLEPEARGNDFIEAGKEKRDRMRIEIANKLQVPVEMLSIHLGSDEIIKAVFRGITSEFEDQNKKPTIFIPFPNYFDAINFAKRFGFNIIPDLGSSDLKNSDDVLKLWVEKIKQQKPDVIYLSNPNNPLGYKLNLADLHILLKIIAPDTRIIIDEVNLDLENNKQIFSFPWEELAKEFPSHHLIFIDSLSKSHDMVSERLGFGLATQRDDAHMLQSFEPPLFPENTFIRAGKALFGEPIENQTRLKIKYFYEQLIQIHEKSNGQINIGPTLSNFCVVEFKNKKLKENFLKKIINLDSGQIPAKKIIGLPIEGSGYLTPKDLNADGTLKEGVFKRKGIIGLSNNSLRLSALNHPIILNALEEALSD